MVLAAEGRGIAAVAAVEVVGEHSMTEYRERESRRQKQTVSNALEEGTNQEWRRQDEELWTL